MKNGKNDLSVWLLILGLVMPVACSRSVSPTGPGSVPNAPSQPIPAPTVSIIPDPHLRAAVANVLVNNGILTQTTDTITTADMATIISLDVESAGVTSLEGLEYCISMTSLTLTNNPITDLAPISSLTGLTQLDLGYVSVTDLTLVGRLTGLQDLYIYGDNFSSLAPLSNLTQLTSLDISSDQATSISPLKNLSNLISLDIDTNNITDIRPIARLPRLRNLTAYTNPITNLPDLSNLTSMRIIDLSNTQVADISPLVGMTSLQEIYLYTLPATVIPDLSALTQLKYLAMGNCHLTDISGVAGLTTLEGADLSANQINDIDALVTAFNNGSFHMNGNIWLNPDPLGGTSTGADLSALAQGGVSVYTNLSSAKPVVGSKAKSAGHSPKTAMGYKSQGQATKGAPRVSPGPVSK